MTSNAPETAATARPTIVLVHGAFADSSSWNGVISRLRQLGYPVVGVANPLRSLTGDARLLRDVWTVSTARSSSPATPTAAP